MPDSTHCGACVGQYPEARVPCPCSPGPAVTHLLEGELLCEDLIVTVRLDPSTEDAQHLTAWGFQKLGETGANVSVFRQPGGFSYPRELVGIMEMSLCVCLPSVERGRKEGAFTEYLLCALMISFGLDKDPLYVIDTLIGMCLSVRVCVHVFVPVKDSGQS